MLRALVLLGLVGVAFKAAKERRDAHQAPPSRWFTYDPPCTFKMLHREGMLEWARAAGAGAGAAGLDALRRDIEGGCSRATILLSTKDPKQRRAFYDLQLEAVRSHLETWHGLTPAVAYVAELRKDFTAAGIDVEAWPDLWG